MSTNNVNPFYIEPNKPDDDEDSWGWEDDTDDLEELLGDGDEDQRHPSAHQPYRSGGRLPVRNLAYEQPSRLRYIVCSLIAAIILISVVSSSGGGSGSPPHSSLNQHDSIEEEGNKPRIIVIGERNSGVTWLEHSLNVCFPNATVSHTLQREGFLFQDEIDLSKQETETHVVVVALNPYDWVHTMRTRPHNAPNHAGIVNWQDFLKKEWTMDRPERDFDMKDKPGPVCQQGFEVNQVVSCVASPDKDPSMNPIYELKRDGSGEAFASILELRADKFRNHVQEVSKWVDSVTVVKYEDLVADTMDGASQTVAGLFNVMQSVAALSHQAWSCSFRDAPPVPLEDEEALTPDFVSFLNEHIDWEAEALFGYSPLTTDTDDDPTAFTDDDDDTAAVNVNDDHFDDGVTYPPTPAPSESSVEADTAAPTPTGADDDKETAAPTGVEGGQETTAPTGAEIDQETTAPISSKAIDVETDAPTLSESNGNNEDSGDDDDDFDDDDESNDDDSTNDDEKSGGDDDDEGDDTNNSGDDDDEDDDDVNDTGDGDDEGDDAIDSGDDDDEDDDANDSGDDDDDDTQDDKAGEKDDNIGKDDDEADTKADWTPSPTTLTPELTLAPTIVETAASTDVPTIGKTMAPTAGPTHTPTPGPTSEATTVTGAPTATDKESSHKGEDKDTKKAGTDDGKSSFHSDGKNGSDEGKDKKKKDDSPTDDKSDKKSSTEKKQSKEGKVEKTEDDDKSDKKKKKKKKHKKKKSEGGDDDQDSDKKKKSDSAGDDSSRKHKHKKDSEGKDDGEKENNDKKKHNKKHHSDEDTGATSKKNW
eukprot:CAMPEP_0119009358 /NCGR_PEP_ID=MMETSP1176-20130426/4311_1 /TAXON_ID=265551 /ORGANISM="Synedropsis recta cf, Strain CCMP1620" /LENGTH=815 /DNA_ID=CAMNT_0006961863 /DNA_START=54 /DNA_END=2498 /DNA_ORIENTATION=-